MSVSLQSLLCSCFQCHSASRASLLVYSPPHLEKLHIRFWSRKHASEHRRSWRTCFPLIPRRFLWKFLVVFNLWFPVEERLRITVYTPRPSGHSMRLNLKLALDHQLLPFLIFPLLNSITKRGTESHATPNTPAITNAQNSKRVQIGRQVNVCAAVIRLVLNSY